MGIWSGIPAHEARLPSCVTSVSRWCTNASQPDLETLFRIAELLDVDVRKLLHVEKDKSK